MRRDVVNRSQNWRDLTPGAKLLISLVVTAGTGVLLYAAINPTSKNIAQFICYLLIALLASRLKVNLPGITGTTASIAAVISLTEGESLRRIWVECYFWSFPYYLVGAGLAGVVGWLNGKFGWQASLLVVPVIYLIYRSYRLYLGKLEDEKRHV